MCKVRKIHLLAINGCLWFAIGARIATIGLGLLSAGIRFLIRWFILK